MNLLDDGLLAAFFLFVLSALSAGSSIRRETRYATGVASALFFCGVAGALAAFWGRSSGFAAGPGRTFLDGFLLLIVLLGLKVLMDRARRTSAAAPAWESVACLCLAFGAVMARAASFGPAAADSPARLSAARFHVYYFVIALLGFTASFVFSLAYLLEDRLIRKKITGRWFRILPPLELTQRLNFASLTVGIAGFVAGTAAGFLHLGRVPSYGALWRDPLVKLSLVILGLYGALLWLRAGRIERGRRFAVLAIAVYALMWACLLLSGHARGGVH